MRFVIYDDETVEPITVVSVPGMGERDIERLPGRTLLLAPSPAASLTAVRGCGAGFPVPIRTSFVEVRFERFGRRDVMVWMAFTRQADLAMLLEPDFLPGQRGEVARLKDAADSISNLFLHALGGRVW